MVEYDLRWVSPSASLEDAHAIRRAVFIEEQGVSEAEEMDDKDGEAAHVVAYENDEPVGTARIRIGENETAKAERVAVREDCREEGLGHQLMRALERRARELGCQSVCLHAQTRVEAFYRRLGYGRVGEEFDEAGISHVEMRKQL